MAEWLTGSLPRGISDRPPAPSSYRIVTLEIEHRFTSLALLGSSEGIGPCSKPASWAHFVNNWRPVSTSTRKWNEDNMG